MSYACGKYTCVPKDVYQVGVFKGLQRAINAVLAAAASGKLSSEIGPALAKYVTPLQVTGKIDEETVNAAGMLALNIKMIRDAFAGVVLDAPNVARYAVELGEWFSYVVGASYNPDAVPKWLWPVSPAAAIAWARQSMKGKR